MYVLINVRKNPAKVGINLLMCKKTAHRARTTAKRRREIWFFVDLVVILLRFKTRRFIYLQEERLAVCAGGAMPQERSYVSETRFRNNTVIGFGICHQ